eukprot:1789404-Prymnesium_polylepis.1
MCNGHPARRYNKYVVIRGLRHFLRPGRVVGGPPRLLHGLSSDLERRNTRLHCRHPHTLCPRAAAGVDCDAGTRACVLDF